LTIGSFRQTPISDFNNREPIFSLAFPTLFLNSLAEFVKPRQREVNLLSYVHHLLCYKDRRFTAHPQFRFTAYNVVVQQITLLKAGFFVQQTRDRAEITVIFTYNIFQVQQLKCPALFVTFSAADYHWYDLMRLLPRFEEWKIASPSLRLHMARDAVRDNPDIVAYFFNKRWELFRKHYLDKVFKVKDHWM
ncbi:hypothetical protein P154DRAFT_382046, partial [Amniculicola lignicola CBS 123094]